MIKIDFHIHTKPVSPWDSDFAFSMEKLQKYVADNALDCIAITNHNRFYKNQFEDIRKKLKSVKVLPGIEIHVLNGHVLVIGKEDSVDEIESISGILSQKLIDLDDHLSLADFSDIVKGKKYLIIPHYYGKTKSLSYANINKIEADIFVGEVGNHKRFNTVCHNGSEKLTPVLFSDLRCKEPEDTEKAGEETRYTYVNVDGVAFDKIYNALKEKKNVSLSPFKDDTFDLLNGSVRGHNGINVILGKRSTGKSYLLNNIYNSFRNEDNVLYIRQFEIANYSSNDQFKKLTDTTNKLEVKNYCQDINDLLLSIHSKDFLDERYDLEQFLSSLNTFADESTMSNAFSKMKLFSYDAVAKEKNKQDNEIVQALKTLLDSDEEHKQIIEGKVSIDSIKDLFRIFLTRAKESELHNMIIDETNRITKSISKALAKESPIEPIKHVSFSDIYEFAYTRKRLNELLGNLKTIDITNNVVSEKFLRKVSIFKPSYSNLKDYKKETGLDRIDSFKGDDIFQAFINKSDELLELVAEDELYRFFIGSSSSITTNGSKDLSGGEKAEYILIEKLQYSKKRDIVLIDEMESSFDNLYLNSFINDLLHKISEESTVFISTHNNNLGVSLEPDYYIYHMYEDSGGKDIYKRFYGSQSAEELSTIDGETIKLSDILVETMEASAKAYDERKIKYEISTNK